MGTGINYRFVTKSAYPLFDMAFLANVYGHLTYDSSRIFRINMEFARTMTDLASCVFEFRRLLQVNKTTWLAIGGSMTAIASPGFIVGEALFHLLYALKGTAFPGMTQEGLILYFVAGSA
jgi:hypothetical protein